MRNRILLTITVCIMTILSMAENYPYRSDLLWVTEPDHPDWIYRTGEKAKIKISLFKYGIPQDGITVRYETGSELMPSDKTGSIVLKNGKAEINIGTLDKPGFRDCIFSVMINGRKYSHHVKVGFSPDKIKPYTEMPDGFMDFWKNNIKEASEFPLKYTKEKAEEYCTEKIDCYLIKLQLNNRGQAVYGYLFYPKNAKPESCPVVLSPPGAGIKTIKEPLRHKYYAEEGFIRLEFEIHGLNPTMSEEQFKEISNAFNGKENGYLTNGLDNKDNYYMKRVYLSCLRCIDLLTSLPEWDGKNVIVQGGSQGGALAMITAGLDKRVTACVVNHPALSDMAGYMAGRAGGYPHFFRTRGMDTKEKLEIMSYYDVVNFARLIKADTFMTWGFNDNTCPPTTSYAVYNTLECNKEALITPINEHWTSEETERGHLEWIKKHLK
ncbi:acetylxylan esterase [Bacteroides caecigallinarum]|uniref:acetylxylan esterase n=1 Tax=Bacteroides caecigallinarum TaxID=1411144 RepID=UPI00195BFADB|nr:acetylxylan esterase [Bacteroides caecigallinarum]MBM6959684.1 acetylxylan esterase [Bacteroides caecigallinarum]